MHLAVHGRDRPCRRKENRRIRATAPRFGARPIVPASTHARWRSAIREKRSAVSPSFDSAGGSLRRFGAHVADVFRKRDHVGPALGRLCGERLGRSEVALGIARGPHLHGRDREGASGVSSTQMAELGDGRFDFLPVGPEIAAEERSLRLRDEGGDLVVSEHLARAARFGQLGADRVEVSVGQARSTPR